MWCWRALHLRHWVRSLNPTLCLVFWLLFHRCYSTIPQSIGPVTSALSCHVCYVCQHWAVHSAQRCLTSGTPKIVDRYG
jgi:hypothetical protein